MTNFDSLCTIKEVDYDQYHFDKAHKDSTDQFFTEDVLLNHLNLSKVAGKKIIGGVNNVYECKDISDPSKLYTYRVSQVARFFIRENDIIFNYEFVIDVAQSINTRIRATRKKFIELYNNYLTAEITKIMNEEKRTLQNWDVASKMKLSPNVIFNGYVKKGNELYQVIVSDKYDHDLEKFFSMKSSDSISKLDDEVAKQLIRLFEKMHTKMGVICFDVKPTNAVIKILKDGVDVRLIDWDGDWCHGNTALLTDNDFRKHVKLMSILFMANYFITFTPMKNIFINYFVDRHGNVRKRIQDMHADMRELFCNEQYKYEFFAQFYILKDTENSKKLREKVKTHFKEKYKDNEHVMGIYTNNEKKALDIYVSKPTKCGFIFDIVFDNVTYRTHPNASDVVSMRRSSSSSTQKRSSSRSSEKRNRTNRV